MPDGGGRLAAKPRAVVIGAGFGGLAAAIRLGARGYSVTLIDPLDKPGGRAYVHEVGGFRFDAGPTLITAPFLLEELWQLAGRRMADDLTLVPVDPFYTIRFDDGSLFSLRADPAATRAEVARFCPDDVAGYDRFLAYAQRIYAIAFEQLAHVPFHDPLRFASLIPKLIATEGYRSVDGIAARYFRDPRLRIAFSFHPLFVGGDPRHTSAFYCLISHLERAHGVHWALGGTGAIATGMADLIAHQGGTVRLKTRVAEILTAHGQVSGVRLDNGEALAADVVVSNADPHTTYATLLKRPDLAPSQRHYSMGLFVWYFGTNRRYDTLDHHTLVMGPRYGRLLDDIFARKHLAEDFSLYLHRPSASDPGAAPAGCDAFYVLSPVPNLGGTTDWGVQGERYRQAVQARLEATVLPGLGEHVIASHVSTPIDFRDRLASPLGAGFSLQPRLMQSAWFRPHNKSPVPGLFLVGAGTHPGAGLPGVLSSARVLDEIVPAPLPTGAGNGGIAVS